MASHQVMVFVGNGFDISVLKKYGNGVTTSYPTFYSFYKYRYPENKDNSLILQMEKARDEGKENWSDFEALLTEQLLNMNATNKEEIDKLNKDLGEIQKAFSRFLNEVVNSDTLEKISAATEQVPKGKKSLAILSISEFLGDLSEKQYTANKFQSKVDNNEKLNMVFINFNYTALLDNYVYLDKESFEPSPYNTSNNNLVFNSNPNNYPGHVGFNDPFCCLTTELHHPHGYQDVPKSLLFGTEPINNKMKLVSAYDSRRMFIKSYWAQSELKYGKFFDESELFIIYGCSMGESDNWWWRKIYTRLKADEAELIIYNFGTEDEKKIKKRFIKGCCIVPDEYTEIVEKNIYVINFGPKANKKVTFLQLS